MELYYLFFIIVLVVVLALGSLGALGLIKLNEYAFSKQVQKEYRLTNNERKRFIKLYNESQRV